MNTLESIGMKKDWLYEIIISSYEAQVPHAAPFGIKTSDFKNLTLEMYKGSNSLKRVLADKEFAINTVDDPAVFYNALYSRDKIHFAPANIINAPILIDSQSNIEVRLTKATEGEKSYQLEAEVVHIQIRGKVELTNRAKGLVLESLILSTRKSLFPALELEKMLLENYRVIKKVAPGSHYVQIMDNLVTDCLGNE